MFTSSIKDDNQDDDFRSCNPKNKKKVIALLFGAATLSVVGVYSLNAAKPTDTIANDVLLEASETNFVMVKANTSCKQPDSMSLVGGNDPAKCASFCKKHSNSGLFAFTSQIGFCTCCGSEQDFEKSNHAAGLENAYRVNPTAINTLPKPEGTKAETSGPVVQNGCSWFVKPSGPFSGEQKTVKIQYAKYDFNHCLDICKQLGDECTGVHQIPESKNCILNLGPWEEKATAPETKIVMVKANTSCKNPDYMSMVGGNDPAKCTSICKKHSNSGLFAFTSRIGYCMCCNSEKDFEKSNHLPGVENIYRVDAPSDQKAWKKLQCVKV